MERLNFNSEWDFCKEGSNTKQSITLPHDAMIHETRSADSKAGGAGAYFPGGVYVYEKTFDVPTEWANKCAIFEFEGVYKDSKVFINEKEAGGRPYGYSNFFVNADAFLQYGQENRIRVVANNANLPNSRWYTGSGIYRPVWLHLGNKVHIDVEGVKVTTLSYNPAKIQVETAHHGGEVTVEVTYNGQVVATGSGDSIQLEVSNATLWSDESPNLYQCKVSLTENGTVVDEVTESFGIRVVAWRNNGLFINGVNTLLRGGCIHHDNGILGACTFAKSEERRVRILKQAGFNAIRSSHNPISKSMLEACDRLGLYVMDETFDMWYFHKDKYDYASDFDTWYLEDTKSMVNRDYNHPSVIMYSIGNEVSEPYQERGVALTKEMVSYIKSLDSTRAVTGGINLMIINLASKGKGIYKEEGGRRNEQNPGEEQASGSLFFNMMTAMIGTGMNKMANSNAADKITSPCLDALDIAGYNYASGRYPLEGKKHPNRIIVGSETFPQDIFKNWTMVKKYPYLIGDFMWAAWDYLGEVGIGAWSYTHGGMNKPYPWLMAGVGAIDILGDIGAEAAYAATVWGLRDKPFIGVRPVNQPGVRVNKSVWRGTNAMDSWSWKNCDGNKCEIEVYSDATFIELQINGKSLGLKKVAACKAEFRTKYQAGTVTAIAYNQSKKEISRNTLTSAIGKSSIRATLEGDTVIVGEPVYVNIDIVGENGVVESNDDRKLLVKVEGGELLAFGSANHCTEEQFDTGSYTTYYGRSQAIVRRALAGTLAIHISGEGLDTVSADIVVGGIK